MTTKTTKIDYAAETLRAAERAQTWRKAAAEAAQNLAELNRTAAEDEAARDALIAAASQGKPVNPDELNKLNAARAKNENEREFLQEVLARINDSLKRAEADHVAASRRERNSRAREIADRRIAAAKKWDAAAAEMQAALSDWDALGQELSGLDLDIISRVGLSGWEAAVGYSRVAAAFPSSIVNRLFPTAQGLYAGSGSLAVTEANTWRDLPEA